ncbi:MAG: DUF1573 domain-containing protein [Bacteroidales bacterium]|nr:DUF1573 domain-containing protein [Bacteroidales bacterium]
MRLKSSYILSLIALALLLMAGDLYAQNNDSSHKKTNPVKSFINNLKGNKAENKTENNQTTPKISIDKTYFDYGQVSQGGNGVAEFSVTNIGGGELVIEDIKVSCGCVVVEFDSSPIKPNETKTIKVKYNTNIVGEIKRSIVIKSNDNQNPKIVLRLTGEVVNNKQIKI